MYLYAGELNLLSNNKIGSQSKLNNGNIFSSNFNSGFDNVLEKRLTKSNKNDSKLIEKSFERKQGSKDGFEVDKYKMDKTTSKVKKAMKKSEDVKSNVNAEEKDVEGVGVKSDDPLTKDSKLEKSKDKDLTTDKTSKEKKVSEDELPKVEDSEVTTLEKVPDVEALALELMGGLTAEVEKVLEGMTVSDADVEIVGKLLLENLTGETDVETLTSKVVEGLGVTNEEAGEILNAFENILTSLTAEASDTVKTPELEQNVGVILEQLEKTVEKMSSDTEVSKTSVNSEVAEEVARVTDKTTATDKPPLEASDKLQNEEEKVVSLRQESTNNKGGDAEQSNDNSKGKESLTNVVAKENSKTQSSGNLTDKVEIQKFENTLISSTNKVQNTGFARLEKSIVDQVMKPIAALSVSENNSEMLIKLNPKNLGSVEMKITIEKGVVLAEFAVENQIVKGVLESNLDDLRNALNDKGFNVEGLDVSVNQGDKGHGNQQFESNKKKANDGKVAFFDNEEADPTSKESLIRKMTEESISILA